MFKWVSKYTWTAINIPEWPAPVCVVNTNGDVKALRSWCQAASLTGSPVSLYFPDRFEISPPGWDWNVIYLDISKQCEDFQLVLFTHLNISNVCILTLSL